MTSRKHSFLIYVFIIALLIPSFIYAEEKIETGLLDIDVSQMSDQYKVRFSNFLRAELEATGAFSIVGRDVMINTLQSKGLSFPERDYATNAIASQVGKMMYVPHMITGGLFRTTASYSINLRLIDCQTGIILESITIDNLSPVAASIEQGLMEAANSLAIAVTGPLDGIRYQAGPLKNMDFVIINGGEYWRGSTMGEKNEEPVKKLSIAPFQIMITEVTQGQWEELMGENPSKHKGENNPVERITVEDIEEFVVLLNIRDKEHDYRLPTEAEWEYACRAGSKTEYHYDDSPSPLKHFAWYEENSGKKTHPVGEKEPNEWGLHDMMGNVFELCQDQYEKNYKNSAKDGRVYFDRNNPEEDRVIRGGCYLSKAKNCRSAARREYPYTKKTHYTGFRLVRIPK